MNHTNNTCCELCKCKNHTKDHREFCLGLCHDGACSCHKQLCHTPTQSWEEEFDKQFPIGTLFTNLRDDTGPVMGQRHANEYVKSFITSLIAQKQKEAVHEYMQNGTGIKNAYEKGKADRTEEVREWAEKAKKVDGGAVITKIIEIIRGK